MSTTAIIILAIIGFLFILGIIVRIRELTCPFCGKISRESRKEEAKEYDELKGITIKTTVTIYYCKHCKREWPREEKECIDDYD